MTATEWFQWFCVGWVMYDVFRVLAGAAFETACFVGRQVRRSLWWLRLRDALKGVVDE